MKLHGPAFDSNLPPAPAEHPLPPSVVSYVAGVVLLSCILGAWSLVRAPVPDGGMVLLWTVAFLVGEAMSFRTPTGRGNISMAATIHLAAIPVAGIPVLLPAAWVARLVSNLMFQRQPWYKAMFNAAQVSLAVLLASQAYRFLGGAPGDAIGPQVLFRLLPGMAAASIGYYVVNTGHRIHEFHPAGRQGGDGGLGRARAEQLPARMQQVLMNLINNAADAMTERGEGRKRLAVWIRWISRDKEIELGVSDSGPGIPPELRRRVFEPSFTTRPAGHGYGLPTVYRIVHNHGGSIAVEAGPEGGGLFRIRIPRRTGAGALRAA